MLFDHVTPPTLSQRARPTAIAIVKKLGLEDAIGTKMPKILAQFAPGPSMRVSSRWCMRI
jgi:hypothetical protein